MLSLLKKAIQISLILIAFFSIINITLAQEAVSNSISSVRLNISPSNPRAGDSVVLTLSSDSIDLNTSKIVWYVDGIAKKDVSGKSITIKTKIGGQNTIINVAIETSDGIFKQISKEISTNGIDLIIEPMSYTLPFLKSKPYYLAQGSVKIVAVPDIMIGGKRALSKDLNFRWTREDDVLSENSGVGRDSIVVNSTIPVRDINIGVKILDNVGNVLVENSKIITKNKPTILFYESSPLYGVLYNKAITETYNLGVREELKIVAKPFSFDFTKDTQTNSVYDWYVNDSYVAPAEKVNEIILRQTPGVKGVASISLDLRNNSKINQYANSIFNVEFGQ